MDADLRAIRHRIGLSQSELGQLLGVDRNSIYRYERGTRKTPRIVLRYLALLVHHYGRKLGSAPSLCVMMDVLATQHRALSRFAAQR